MALARSTKRPESYPMQAWIAGSAVGVFLLAMLSDCVFRNRLFFAQIATCLVF